MIEKTDLYIPCPVIHICFHEQECLLSRIITRRFISSMSSGILSFFSSESSSTSTNVRLSVSSSTHTLSANKLFWRCCTYNCEVSLESYTEGILFILSMVTHLNQIESMFQWQFSDLHYIKIKVTLTACKLLQSGSARKLQNTFNSCI